MKLIIDIPEEIYNHTQEYEVGGFNQENDTKLFMAIKNGTPLEAIKADVHRHKMHFYPSDYTFINTLIDKWTNRGVDV